MPDGYGNPVPNPYHRPAREIRTYPDVGLIDRIRELELRMDRMDAKLARRDKKIARLERLTKGLD